MKISWQLLAELENRYGDTFYILDLDKFRVNYQEFLAAFASIYPRTKIAYSYKTNYTPILCQMVDSMGGFAEVVSHIEYDLALRVGVSPEKIIFNGPYKSKSDIALALCRGSIVNLDSNYEINIVNEVASKYPERNLRVGLRCNFEVEPGIVSRFGFDVNGLEFKVAIDRLTQLNNCTIAGLHCHFHTERRSVETYGLIADKMIRIAKDYFSGSLLQFVDLGGGFFSRMSKDLRDQFHFYIPSFDEYAKAIASQFLSAFPDGDGPDLILEPGLALTADVMKFVAKVIDIKTIRSRKMALVSGSIYNIKPTKSTRKLPMTVFKSNANQSAQGWPEGTDIVGYTCMEDDCLFEGYRYSLGEGDYVIFDNVGAYTLVLKPPFIMPCPVVVAFDSKSGSIEKIKDREVFSNIFANFVFP
jgi:diaminopimelate decarboxylase